MMRLQHIIILQNKIDLIQESAAINQHESIQKFISGRFADGDPVVPISAQLKYNVDVVCEYLVKKIPIPQRNFTSPPHMIIIHSFDVNKPDSEADEIKGGVAGGSILRGVLKVCQFIKVRPGIPGQGKVRVRLVGVRTKGTEKQGKVSKRAKGEILTLNIGSMSTGAPVVAAKHYLAKLQLAAPVCTSKGGKKLP